MRKVGVCVLSSILSSQINSDYCDLLPTVPQAYIVLQVSSQTQIEAYYGKREMYNFVFRGDWVIECFLITSNMKIYVD